MSSWDISKVFAPIVENPNRTPLGAVKNRWPSNGSGSTTGPTTTNQADSNRIINKPPPAEPRSDDWGGPSTHSDSTQQSQSRNQNPPQQQNTQLYPSQSDTWSTASNHNDPNRLQGLNQSNPPPATATTGNTSGDDWGASPNQQSQNRPQERPPQNDPRHSQDSNQNNATGFIRQGDTWGGGSYQQFSNQPATSQRMNAPPPHQATGQSGPSIQDPSSQTNQPPTQANDWGGPPAKTDSSQPHTSASNQPTPPTFREDSGRGAATRQDEWSHVQVPNQVITPRFDQHSGQVDNGQNRARDQVQQQMGQSRGASVVPGGVAEMHETPDITGAGGWSGNADGGSSGNVGNAGTVSGGDGRRTDNVDTNLGQYQNQDQLRAPAGMSSESRSNDYGQGDNWAGRTTSGGVPISDNNAQIRPIEVNNGREGDDWRYQKTNSIPIPNTVLPSGSQSNGTGGNEWDNNQYQNTNNSNAQPIDSQIQRQAPPNRPVQDQTRSASSFNGGGESGGEWSGNRNTQNDQRAGQLTSSNQQRGDVSGVRKGDNEWAEANSFSANPRAASVSSQGRTGQTNGRSQHNFNQDGPYHGPRGPNAPIGRGPPPYLNYNQAPLQPAQAAPDGPWDHDAYHRQQQHRTSTPSRTGDAHPPTSLPTTTGAAGQHTSSAARGREDDWAAQPPAIGTSPARNEVHHNSSTGQSNGSHGVSVEHEQTPFAGGGPRAVETGRQQNSVQGSGNWGPTAGTSNAGAIPINDPQPLNSSAHHVKGGDRSISSSAAPTQMPISQDEAPAQPSQQMQLGGQIGLAVAKSIAVARPTDHWDQPPTASDPAGSGSTPAQHHAQPGAQQSVRTNEAPNQNARSTSPDPRDAAATPTPKRPIPLEVERWNEAPPSVAQQNTSQPSDISRPNSNPPTYNVGGSNSYDRNLQAPKASDQTNGLSATQRLLQGLKDSGWNSPAFGSTSAASTHGHIPDSSGTIPGSPPQSQGWEGRQIDRPMSSTGNSAYGGQRDWRPFRSDMGHPPPGRCLCGDMHWRKDCPHGYGDPNCRCKGFITLDCSVHPMSNSGHCTCGKLHAKRDCGTNGKMMGDRNIECRRCTGRGHEASTCDSPPCSVCQETTHFRSFCPHIKCERCCEYGHVYRHCLGAWCEDPVKRALPFYRIPRGGCRGCGGPHWQMDCQRIQRLRQHEAGTSMAPNDATVDNTPQQDRSSENAMAGSLLARAGPASTAEAWGGGSEIKSNETAVVSEPLGSRRGQSNAGVSKPYIPDTDQSRWDPNRPFPTVSVPWISDPWPESRASSQDLGASGASTGTDNQDWAGPPIIQNRTPAQSSDRLESGRDNGYQPRENRHLSETEKADGRFSDAASPMESTKVGDHPLTQASNNMRTSSSFRKSPVASVTSDHWLQRGTRPPRIISAWDRPAVITGEIFDSIPAEDPTTPKAKVDEGASASTGLMPSNNTIDQSGDSVVPSPPTASAAIGDRQTTSSTGEDGRAKEARKSDSKELNLSASSKFRDDATERPADMVPQVPVILNHTVRNGESADSLGKYETGWTGPQQTSTSPIVKAWIQSTFGQDRPDPPENPPLSASVSSITASASIPQQEEQAPSSSVIQHAESVEERTIKSTKKTVSMPEEDLSHPMGETPGALHKPVTADLPGTSPLAEGMHVSAAPASSLVLPMLVPPSPVPVVTISADTSEQREARKAQAADILRILNGTQKAPGPAESSLPVEQKRQSAGLLPEERGSGTSPTVLSTIDPANAFLNLPEGTGVIDIVSEDGDLRDNNETDDKGFSNEASISLDSSSSAATVNADILDRPNPTAQGGAASAAGSNTALVHSGPRQVARYVHPNSTRASRQSSKDYDHLIAVRDQIQSRAARLEDQLTMQHANFQLVQSQLADAAFENQRLQAEVANSQSLRKLLQSEVGMRKEEVRRLSARLIRAERDKELAVQQQKTTELVKQHTTEQLMKIFSQDKDVVDMSKVREMKNKYEDEISSIRGELDSERDKKTALFADLAETRDKLSLCEQRLRLAVEDIKANAHLATELNEVSEKCRLAEEHCEELRMIAGARNIESAPDEEVLNPLRIAQDIIQANIATEAQMQERCRCLEEHARAMEEKSHAASAELQAITAKASTYQEQCISLQQKLAEKDAAEKGSKAQDDRIRLLEKRNKDQEAKLDVLLRRIGEMVMSGSMISPTGQAESAHSDQDGNAEATTGPRSTAPPITIKDSSVPSAIGLTGPMSPPSSVILSQNEICEK